MIKYKATYDNKIEQVKVESETEHFVKIGGRRHAKKVSWVDEGFFDTHIEAREFIIKKLNRLIDGHKVNLDFTERLLFNFIKENS